MKHASTNSASIFIMRPGTPAATYLHPTPLCLMRCGCNGAWGPEQSPGPPWAQRPFIKLYTRCDVRGISARALGSKACAGSLFVRSVCGLVCRRCARLGCGLGWGRAWAVAAGSQAGGLAGPGGFAPSPPAFDYAEKNTVNHFFRQGAV